MKSRFDFRTKKYGGTSFHRISISQAQGFGQGRFGREFFRIRKKEYNRRRKSAFFGASHNLWNRKEKTRNFHKICQKPY